MSTPEETQPTVTKPEPMKRDTPVKWVGQTTGKKGHGITVSNEINGHILVAVLSDPNGKDRSGGANATDEHRVIYCTVTWLTPYESTEVTQ